MRLSISTAAYTLKTPLGRKLGESLATLRYLLLVAAPLGALVGCAIAGYDFVVNELLWNHLKQLPLWVQLWSPAAAMLLAGSILAAFRVRSPSMADEVVKAYHSPRASMPTGTAAAKLVASIATMGLGASAGMEGASKWLGATIGSTAQKGLNKLSWKPVQWEVRSALLTGGSAGIAAIFRAPLSGAIMGVESPYKHDLAHEALLTSLVAAATSFWSFTRLRNATPYFPINFQYTLQSRDLLVALPLGLCAGLASHLFLGLLARLRTLHERLPLPLPLRSLCGGLLLVAAAYLAQRLIGAPVTLQAGLPVANDLLNGKYTLLLCVLIFALKLFATSVTFGFGGVGGLFVPTATIGAALGACFDAVLAPGHPGVYTLLGIAAFAGASYSSLLFAAVFIAESTGNVFLAVPALISSTVAFLVSAGVSNSGAQLSRRAGPDEKLAAIPVAQAMSTRLITAAPDQTLAAFTRRMLLEHHFKALPVVDAEGKLLGMVSLATLRAVPIDAWPATEVGAVMDAAPRTLGPEHAVADAAQLLRQGLGDYVPIVDPSTFKLVGIISASDIQRALLELAPA